MQRLAAGSLQTVRSVRHTAALNGAQQYRALALRFNSTEASGKAAEVTKKSGLRFRTKALITLTLVGAGVGGVIKHSFEDPEFRTLLEENIPHFAHSLDKIEQIKDNEDLAKVLAAASVASETVVDLSKDAYRQASDLINGTTTPAPEKKAPTTTSQTPSAPKVPVVAAEQPKPAVPASRAEYVPSTVPQPAFLPGSAPGKVPAKKDIPATIAEAAEKTKEVAKDAVKKVEQKVEAAKDKVEEKFDQVKEKTIEMVQEAEKKAEKAIEAVKPKEKEPIKPIVFESIKADEPIVNNLQATLQQLVSILNETGISEQGHQVFVNARKDIEDLTSRVEALKAEGEAQALTVMTNLQDKHDKALQDLEAQHEGKISELKNELTETFEEQQKKAIAQELAIQKEVLLEQQRQDLMKHAIDIQRRWVREVKMRVENERGGRLARLDHINLRLKTLERQGLDTSEFLDLSSRTHQLWCSIKALEKAYEAGERRPFDRELTRLRRIAETEKDSELLNAVLAAVPETLAAQGVDSVPELMDRFQIVRQEVRKASLVPENGGVLAHGMSVVLSKLMFQKHGLVPGNDVEAILARTEHYLQESDLEQAVRELNQLQGWGKRLAKDWIIAARQRVEVGQAIDVINTHCNLASLTLA